MEEKGREQLKISIYLDATLRTVLKKKSINKNPTLNTGWDFFL